MDIYMPHSTNNAIEPLEVSSNQPEIKKRKIFCYLGPTGLASYVKERSRVRELSVQGAQLIRHSERKKERKKERKINVF